MTQPHQHIPFLLKISLLRAQADQAELPPTERIKIFAYLDRLLDNASPIDVATLSPSALALLRAEVLMKYADGNMEIGSSVTAETGYELCLDITETWLNKYKDIVSSSFGNLTEKEGWKVLSAEVLTKLADLNESKEREKLTCFCPCLFQRVLSFPCMFRSIKPLLQPLYLPLQHSSLHTRMLS